MIHQNHNTRTARDAPWDICRISPQTNLDITGIRKIHPKHLPFNAKFISFCRFTFDTRDMSNKMHF